jgi:dihydrolipoamide dehydrogenase
MVVGEFSQEANLVVIGGGPAGYAAAFRAAELGVETVIVDPRPALGGVCLHEGCVASKTLLHVAEAIHLASAAAGFGVTFEKPRIEPDRVQAWVGEVVGRLASGLESMRTRHGIEHLRGEAAFEDSRTIAIHGETTSRLRFKRALIATGALPAAHPMLPFDGDRVLTPGQASRVRDIAATTLVIGGGYQAIELASVHAALGSEVTLIDESDAFLPSADPDLARVLMRRLESRLAEVRGGVTVGRAEPHHKRLRLTFSSDGRPKRSEYDRIIVALAEGVRPSLERLHLDRTQARTTDAGFIEVTHQMQTTNPRLFAAGDVTGPPLLADRALAQGRIAAEVIAGWSSRFDARAIPFVIFTDPNLAWCGLTETEAKASGVAYEARRIPWGASGRAVGMGRATDGVTKIIYDPDTELVLGVGLVGPHTAEMIGEACLAIEMGAVLTDLASTLHPHPSMSELIADAARRP